MLTQMIERPLLKNAILARLSPPDLAAVCQCCEFVALKERSVLVEARRRSEHIYFLESGLVSVRIVAPDGTLETAIVGSRGAVGVSVLLGGHVPTHQWVVLAAGRALRIHVDDMRRLMDQRTQLREHLLRYTQALRVHCAQIGLCGTRHDLKMRLACWLCLASGAADGYVLPVTHEYISDALGLRRSGVTAALNRFEEQGLIRKMRGVLHIIRRKDLEQRTCSCYGIISSEYAS